MPAREQNGAAAEERGWAQSEKETVSKTKILADNKVIIVQPTPELRKALQEIGATMAKEWETSAGADGKALMEAYRK